ncbi:hypothetical protein BJV82DRAFT_713618 [Fennellomyces sp. T-0311]|nr:hypothetical protein BJV82DRAFT_713618 [Fennellomyces sp. T-0311]
MTISGIDNAAEADEKELKNVGFMTALPSDIILEIFSYVSQQDCLRCMTVCQAWDSAIPQYTQHLWKHLTLGSNDVYNDYRSRERCLGSHVKHLYVNVADDRELCVLVQKLVDWGCTEIQSLELDASASTMDQKTFVDALGTLATHLTHLTLPDHLSSILLPHILNVCPELTHFTALRTIPRSSQNQASSTKVTIDRNTKLKHLSLGYTIDRDQLECILKKCPDLRCFISEPLRHSRYQSRPFTDFDSLFSWCPKINYLSTILAPVLGRSKGPDPYITDHIGVRYLSTANCYTVDQIARCLAGNQSTLEILAIHNNYSNDHKDDFTSLFRSLQLSRLQTLTISDIFFSAESFVVLLNHCPSLVNLQLSSLYLNIDSAAISLLHPMNHLQFLQLSTNFKEELSLITLLERFPGLTELDLSGTLVSTAVPSRTIMYPRQLKRLSLAGIRWKHDPEVEQDEAVAYLLHSVAQNLSLESIRICLNTPLGFKSLRSLAILPTLKFMDLCVSNRMTDDESVEFIIALRGSIIETLNLININDLSFAALDALAGLPHLSAVSSKTQYPAPRRFQRVSNRGLEQMLRYSPNLKQACFTNISLEDDGVELTRDQVEELVQHKIPRYNGLGTGCWKAEITDMREDKKHGKNAVPYSVNGARFSVDMERTVIG